MAALTLALTVGIIIATIRMPSTVPGILEPIIFKVSVYFNSPKKCNVVETMPTKNPKHKIHGPKTSALLLTELLLVSSSLYGNIKENCKILNAGQTRSNTS
jgi:hypothetical protein